MPYHCLWLMAILFVVSSPTISNGNQTLNSQHALSNDKSSSSSSAQSQQIDEMNQIYQSFIDKLLENRKFVDSTIQSLQYVLYNQWIADLSYQIKKKYLKIILTTVQDDDYSSLKSEQYFVILQKLLQDPQIAEAFFNSLKFDFSSDQFRTFISKEYPSQSKVDFNKLTIDEKAKLYLLALHRQVYLEKIKDEDKQKQSSDNNRTEAKTQSQQ